MFCAKFLALRLSLRRQPQSPRLRLQNSPQPCFEMWCHSCDHHCSEINVRDTVLVCAFVPSKVCVDELQERLKLHYCVMSVCEYSKVVFFARSCFCSCCELTCLVNLFSSGCVLVCVSVHLLCKLHYLATPNGRRLNRITKHLR